MRKVFGGLLGILIGYGAWFITKWVILLSGPYLLDVIGISASPRVVANLESVANILGLIVLVLVFIKIYKSFTGKTQSKTNQE